jgi:5-methylcytosine-specific restriction protein A
MPWSPKPACAVRTCPYRTPCPVHGTTQWANRASSHARGYNSGKWITLRKLVLERDGYICQARVLFTLGGRRIDGPCARDATHVDHVVPKSAGGTDELDNLRALCPQHHAKKTAQEGQGGRRR